MRMLNSPLNPELDLQSRTRPFERRDHLPLSLDQLWQIEFGVVRTLIWTEEGALTTLGLWSVGDVVGE